MALPDVLPVEPDVASGAFSDVPPVVPYVVPCQKLRFAEFSFFFVRCFLDDRRSLRL